MAQSPASVVDTLYTAPSALFNGSVSAVNRDSGASYQFVVVNGVVSLALPPAFYRVTYLAGNEYCSEVWHVPEDISGPFSIFQLRGNLGQCNITAASDATFTYRNTKGRLVPVPNVFNPRVSHSVTDAGAVPDGILRTDGAMTANSPVLTSVSGSFSAKDVGKYIQVVGAGAGGTTHSDGAITAGRNVLTSAAGTFVSEDVGRYVVVVGAGAQGTNLLAQIMSFASPTQVNLGNLSGTQMLPANAAVTVTSAPYYYGYMTLEATITSYQSAKQVTLSTPALATISSAMYAYGTNNTANFQAELDALGAAGGGVVHVPAPASCPAGATCGYVTAATDMATVRDSGAIKIRYDKLSLVGDSPQTNLFCRGAWSFLFNAAIRGHCVVIGDSTGPLPSSASVSNITVSNLHLWGMTNGNTYNHVFPASPITGDGWDITHKAFFMAHDVPHNNIAIVSNVAQDFKGENIWCGGLGFSSLLVQGNTLKNFNGSGVSVSVDNLQVLNNTITSGFTGVENGLFGATTVRQVFQSNQISLMRGAGITLVSEDNVMSKGSVQILDNTLDTISQIGSVGPAQAIFIGLASGSAPIPNITIERNLCHDCRGFIYPTPGPNLIVRENTMTIDKYDAVNFFLFPMAMNNALVEANHSIFTPFATSHGHTMGYIYVVTFNAAANTLSYSNDVFLNNTWQGNGAIYYFFSTTAGAGFQALANKNIIWQGDACTGCDLGQDVNRGGQFIVNGGVIEPYGPQVVLYSGTTGKPVMTVDASKEQDGSELNLLNVGAVPVTFLNDGNLKLVAPLTIPVSGRTKLRYSGLDSKWHLVLP